MLGRPRGQPGRGGGTGCAVHVYDASSRPPQTGGGGCRDGGVEWCRLGPAAAPLVTFFGAFLGVEDSPPGPGAPEMVTFATAVARLREATGLEHVDVAKVDCEVRRKEGSKSFVPGGRHP